MCNLKSRREWLKNDKEVMEYVKHSRFYVITHRKELKFRNIRLFPSSMLDIACLFEKGEMHSHAEKAFINMLNTEYSLK